MPMLEKGENRTLLKFLRDARVAPKMQFTGISNKVAVPVKAENIVVKTVEGLLQVKAVSCQNQMQIETGAVPQNMTDGQVADEQYSGQRCYYNMFFLTSRDHNAGSNGPFYIQLEGTMGVTGLMEFYPWSDDGQWWFLQMYDDYVGEVHTIRVAAGTSDGWYFSHLLILYPRGHVWTIDTAWIDTDNPCGVVEIHI